MLDLTIGGATFNVLIEGDETLPVVVLSNALGSDVHLWDAQMPDLLEHFRVVRYNSRGHGGSTIGDGPYSIEGLGRDALAILDALDIEKAHWVGVSKGGAVGQWLLIHAPERIERAVLANTSARFGPPDAWNERILRVQHDGLIALAETIMKRWFTDSFAAREADRVDSLRQTLLATSPEGYAAACAALRDMDLREGLHGIDRPVLIIAGRDDLTVSQADTSFLAKTIPGAKLVMLDTRHLSNVEDSAGFTKSVVDFLTAKVAARQRVMPQAIRPLTPARRPPGRRATPSRVAPADSQRRTPAAGGTIGKTTAAAPQVPAAAARSKTTRIVTARPTTASAAPASTKTVRPKMEPSKMAPSKTAKSAAPSAGRPSAKGPKLVVSRKPPAKDIVTKGRDAVSPGSAASRAAPGRGKAQAATTHVRAKSPKVAPAASRPKSVVSPTVKTAASRPVTKPPLKAKIAAPIKAKASPIKIKAAPTKGKAASSKIEAAPKNKAAPPKNKAAPTKNKAAPTKIKAAAVKPIAATAKARPARSGVTKPKPAAAGPAKAAGRTAVKTAGRTAVKAAGKTTAPVRTKVSSKSGGKVPAAKIARGPKASAPIAKAVRVGKAVLPGKPSGIKRTPAVRGATPKKSSRSVGRR